jgi:dTMP kinase
MFLTFDGIDGVGKSTQIKLLTDWLQAAGQRVTLCRDPGSTALGDALREILLHRAELQPDRRAEMFMYMAARAQLVTQVIQPALARGEIVLSDRFLLANVVYQGHAGGLDVAELWRIGQTATQGIEPTLTILLDISPDRAASRMSRPLDRMEQQGAEFTAKLRTGFLAEALRRPDQIAVLDADRSVDEIQADIRSLVGQLLPGK